MFSQGLELTLYPFSVTYFKIRLKKFAKVFDSCCYGKRGWILLPFFFQGGWILLLPTVDEWKQFYLTWEIVAVNLEKPVTLIKKNLAKVLLFVVFIIKKEKHTLFWRSCAFCSCWHGSWCSSCWFAVETVFFISTSSIAVTLSVANQ